MQFQSIKNKPFNFEKWVFIFSIFLAIAFGALGVGWSIYHTWYSPEIYLGENKETSEQNPLKFYNSALKQMVERDLDSAEKYWNRALKLSDKTNPIYQKSLYNLGNLFWDKAQDVSSDNLEKQIEFLQVSASIYRSLLVFTEELPQKLREDTHFNFELVQNKISFLIAQSKEKEIQEIKKKNEYELILEIEKLEKEIISMIQQMKNSNHDQERLEISETVSELRERNFVYLKELYKKLNLAFEANELQLKSFSI